jgi:hypothetical protein
MYEAPVHDKKYCTETAPLVSDKQIIFTMVTAVFLIKKKHLKDQASCTCEWVMMQTPTHVFDPSSTAGHAIAALQLLCKIEGFANTKHCQDMS